MHVIINSSTGFSTSPQEDAVDVNFVGQTTVNVIHNKSTRPIVNISNSNGQQIFAEIIYPTLNNFTVNFNTPQSGLIRYI